MSTRSLVGFAGTWVALAVTSDCLASIANVVSDFLREWVLMKLSRSKFTSSTAVCRTACMAVSSAVGILPVASLSSTPPGCFLSVGDRTPV
ncbi:hypothetical protein B0T26DRAFT_299474 [Lasiosphaeria miniovina]|uniref:Secreted protein n=1 Tax=Lasiosphaeria miniovina TaxID=1954250 RepID=A0AA40AKM1_9PEZI|nr:uncharacterized protein B0T26DRAFT_299474 [Lasiosphaeria miniovina]KAK0717583.1 hypothetical protein B0T26DRAFT_299474 [Lasiosphaeria miniovina]